MWICCRWLILLLIPSSCASIRLSPIPCGRSPAIAMAAGGEGVDVVDPRRRFQYMWADAGITGLTRLAALNPARWSGDGGCGSFFGMRMDGDW